MAFIKQGNEMRYSEVTALVESLVKKEVLVHLQESEVKSFFIKLYNWQMEDLCRWVKRADYDTKNKNKMLETAYLLKLITYIQVWHKGGELAERINQGVSVTKDEIVDFIKEEWLKEMKADTAIITTREENLMTEEDYEEEA